MDLSRSTALLFAAAALLVAPASAHTQLFCSDPEASVVVAGIAISDNGDSDGIGDTLESLLIELTIRNVGSIDLTGLAGVVTSEDPDVCVTDGLFSIAALDVGESATTLPIVVHVTDVDRSDPFENLSASFDLLIRADQVFFVCVLAPFEIDLDLDVAGGAGPTSWIEGFESGVLSTFEKMNLDAGIPGNSDAEGLVNGDGYRCQYSDPDREENGTFGLQSCYPGVNLAHSEAVFWQIDGATVPDTPDGGRAYTGTHSLYFGIYLPFPPGGHTTPLAVLDAVATTDPVNLGLGQSELSFSHQVGLPLLQDAFGTATVQIQLADSAGGARGDWIKLEPYRNVYDSRTATNVSNACFFDPIDDGTTEDDFFDPTDPQRRLGPSSTCAPGYVFTRMGDTLSYHPSLLGSAEGPGLQGSLGVGTWVESVVDLSRWRGRRLRLRFLTATGTLEANETWAEAFGGTGGGDDGWWIDDVTVSGALTTAATVLADTTDNSGLPGPPGGNADADGDGIYDVCDTCPDLPGARQTDQDLDGEGDACDPCLLEPGGVGEDPDGDGLCLDNCPNHANFDQVNSDGDPAGDRCDCADFDPTVYPGAVEINDGKDNQCFGEVGWSVKDEISGNSGFHDPENKDAYSWTAQGGASAYQVARSPSADFSSGCVILGLFTGTVAIDDDQVPPGTTYYYLVRPRSPLLGSWGHDSEIDERIFSCPN